MSGDEPRTLIAGLGNIFLGDDAFGVELIRRLRERPPPEGVRVADFGIRGMDLVYAMQEGYDLVILVDAVSRGGTPGTLYLIEPEMPAAGGDDVPAPLDPHDVDPENVLRLVGYLGRRVGRLLLVGCEPATLEPASGDACLSRPVAAAVEPAIDMIRQLLSNRRCPPAAISEQRSA